MISILRPFLICHLTARHSLGELAMLWTCGFRAEISGYIQFLLTGFSKRVSAPHNEAVIRLVDLHVANSRV